MAEFTDYHRMALERANEGFIEHDKQLKEVKARLYVLEEALDRETGRINRFLRGDEDTGAPSVFESMTTIRIQVEEVRRLVRWMLYGGVSFMVAVVAYAIAVLLQA